ncbi:MAG: tripartite tricarboxylate transporter substrate binding protein [Alkalispirochaeta sp.]
MIGNNTKKARMLLIALAVAVIGIPVLGASGVEEGEYPSRNIRLIIPTGEGGSADRVAQAVTNVWREYLGVEFERSFHPGASGQVGYEVFMDSEPDGYTLLTGNLSAEMIMYGLQDPDYDFPEDLVYFASVGTDPQVLWVPKDSPFETIEELVEESKERPITVSTSRLPHPATIGAAGIADATGGEFRMVPYGGGSAARTAGVTGEVDASIDDVGSSTPLADDIRFLVMFQSENLWPDLSEDVPTVNDVFDTDLPNLGSIRVFAVQREFIEQYPERFEILVSTLQEAMEDPRMAEEHEAVGFDGVFVSYQGMDETMADAERMLGLVEQFEDYLTE